AGQDALLREAAGPQGLVVPGDLLAAGGAEPVDDAQLRLHHGDGSGALAGVHVLAHRAGLAGVAVQPVVGGVAGPALPAPEAGPEAPEVGFAVPAACVAAPLVREPPGAAGARGAGAARNGVTHDRRRRRSPGRYRELIEVAVRRTATRPHRFRNVAGDRIER